MVILLLRLLRLIPFFFAGPRQLALENLALHQQLAVYKRSVTRPRLRRTDRLFWVGLTRIWAGWRRPLGNRDSRHCPAMAAAPLPRVLDQALWPPDRRSPARQCRDQDPGRPHGRREPTLGRPTHPWRTPQARHRCGRAHRLSVDSEATLPAIADLANLSDQSCPGLGLDRFLHRAHCSAPRPLRPRRARPPPPAPRPLQRDRASHRRLDLPATRRRVPAAPLGLGLWRCAGQRRGPRSDRGSRAARMHGLVRDSRLSPQLPAV